METVSAITALVIAVSVIMTAVFNARKGSEDLLKGIVEKQEKRIAELERIVEEREKQINERDTKIDELERRVNTLSNELQKITHPKMKTGRLKKKL